jgi:hypothetical protein
VHGISILPMLSSEVWKLGLLPRLLKVGIPFTSFAKEDVLLLLLTPEPSIRLPSCLRDVASSHNTQNSQHFSDLG